MPIVALLLGILLILAILAVLAVLFDPPLLCRPPIAKKMSKICRVSSAPCVAIVAWILRIFIVFENQIMLGDFANVVIAILF